jgi:hypothetical protein
VIVGGRSGTLGEFPIAYEQGKLIGVLTGTGGITPAQPAMQANLAEKATGADVVYDSDPDRLVSALLGRYVSGEYVCQCLPESIKEGAHP